MKKLPNICPKCKSPYWDTPLKKIKKEFISKISNSMISMHDMIIKESGGLEGTRDKGGIEHSVFGMLNSLKKNSKDHFYSVAKICNHIAKRSHFIDGNKRTSYIFSKIMLIAYGFHLKPNYEKAVPFILKVAEFNSKVSVNEISKWLKGNSEKIKSKNIEIYLKELFFDIINKDDEKRWGHFK